MIERLKRLLCAEELDALKRYRLARQTAQRYNASIPGSAETAEWIRQVGEGKRIADIEHFRAKLARSGK
jgi:hypothetical protein